MSFSLDCCPAARPTRPTTLRPGAPYRFPLSCCSGFFLSSIDQSIFPPAGTRPAARSVPYPAGQPRRPRNTQLSHQPGLFWIRVSREVTTTDDELIDVPRRAGRHFAPSGPVRCMLRRLLPRCCDRGAVGLAQIRPDVFFTPYISSRFFATAFGRLLRIGMATARWRVALSVSPSISARRRSIPRDRASCWVLSELCCGGFFWFVFSFVFFSGFSNWCCFIGVFFWLFMSQHPPPT